MKIKDNFNVEQLKALLAIGIVIDDREYTGNELLEMDEKITNYIMTSGFDRDYKPNELCIILESIIDIFSDIQ